MHSFFPRLFLLGAFALTAISNAFAQSAFTETFPYPNGNLVGQGPAGKVWTAIVGSSGNTVQVAANAISLATSGQDPVVPWGFTIGNGSRVYVGFDLRVSTAGTGDYFLAITGSNYTSSGGGISGRLFIKASGGGYVLGYLTGTGGTPVYSSRELAFGTTYRVVTRYDSVAGVGNKRGLFYVNPVDLVDEAGNTPEIAAQPDTTAGSNTLAALVVRQGTAGSAAVVSRLDNIAVSSAFGLAATSPGSSEPEGPTAVAITLGRLNQIYDGAGKTVTAKTAPAGVAVNVTYDGAATLPVLPGTYAVSATVADPVTYTGTASGMLTIANATQSLTFSPVARVTVATPVTLTAASSAGLPVSFAVVSGNATLSPPVHLSGETGPVSVCTLVANDGNLITVRASQDGDANTNAATPVDRRVVAGTTPIPFTQTQIDAAAAEALLWYQYNLEWDWHSTRSVTALTLMLHTVSLDPDYRATDGTYLKDRILEHFRSTLIGGREPGCSGGLDTVAANQLIQAFAIAKGIPALWDALTAEEKGKITLLVQMALVASHWGHDDDNNFNTGLNQLGNFNKGWNPNMMEGGVGMGIAATHYLGGAAAANAFLLTFDYDSFLASVDAAGLTSIKANLQATGKTALEAATRNTYTFHGFGLEQPFQWIKFRAEIGWDQSVAPTGAAGLGYILAGAAGLPNLGQLGMGHEFNTIDENGGRSSLEYVAWGWINLIPNRLFLQFTGDWTSASEPERLALETKYEIGSVDLIYKAVRGYHNYAKGADRGDSSESTLQTTMGYRFVKELWSALPLLYVPPESSPLTITLGDLNRVYDGSPKNVTATTEPAGIPVTITYDGSSQPPTNAGAYAVRAVAAAENFSGSATGVLTIGKAPATVTLSDLAHTYDGTPHPAMVTTSPAGVPVNVTYGGGVTASSVSTATYTVIETPAGSGRVPSFGPNGTHWPDLVPTPFMYDAAVPNVIEVDCSWSAIGSALASVTDAQAAAGVLIKVAPGNLVGQGTTGAGTFAAVLANLGSTAWTKRVTICPRDGYGTLTFSGGVKFYRIYGVCFAGLSGDDIKLQGCTRSALAWTKLTGWMGIYGDTGQTTTQVEIVETAQPTSKLSGLDASDFYTAGGDISDWRIDGCYAAPYYRPEGNAGHCDTLQWSGALGGTYSSMTIRDGAYFASSNCAIQTGGVNGLTFIHTYLAGGMVSRTRYPFLPGADSAAGQAESIVNGGGLNFQAIDSEFIGNLALNTSLAPQPWILASNTRRQKVDQTSMQPIAGAWIVDTTMSATNPAMPVIPTDAYLNSIWGK